MKKTALYVLLVLSLLLAACKDSTTTPIPAETQAPAPSVTTAPTIETGAPVSDCTVIAQEPTPGSTAQSLFPPIGAEDWVKGPEDAYVTIMEYGDFQ